MKIKKKIGKDCCGGKTHNYKFRCVDGYDFEMTFFKKAHTDDMGNPLFTIEVVTDYGTLLPSFVLHRDTLKQLAKIFEEETP